MKKLKLIAALFAVVFTVAGAFAKQESDSSSFTTGARASNCPSAQNLSQGTCYDSQNGNICTIINTTDFAFVSGAVCGAVLRDVQ